MLLSMLPKIHNLQINENKNEKKNQIIFFNLYKNIDEFILKTISIVFSIVQNSFAN